MKSISTSLISRNRYALIGNEVEALLMIIFMHYNGIISDAKMFGMFKGLRLNFGHSMSFGFGSPDYFPNLKPKNNKALLRMIKTYHCTITDRWFNDEAMYTILQETFQEVNIVKKEMPMDVFMGYLNKFLNRGKVVCYSFIEHEIIDKVYHIFEYDFDMGVSLFKEMGLISTGNYTSYYNFEASGYCCDDCDGDFETYKKGQYKYYVVDRMIKDIKEQLKQNKIKNYEKYK